MLVVLDLELEQTNIKHPVIDEMSDLNAMRLVVLPNHALARFGIAIVRGTAASSIKRLRRNFLAFATSGFLLLFFFVLHIMVIFVDYGTDEDSPVFGPDSASYLNVGGHSVRDENVSTTSGPRAMSSSKNQSSAPKLADDPTAIQISNMLGCYP